MDLTPEEEQLILDRRAKAVENEFYNRGIRDAVNLVYAIADTHAGCYNALREAAEKINELTRK